MYIASAWPDGWHLGISPSKHARHDPRIPLNVSSSITLLSNLDFVYLGYTLFSLVGGYELSEEHTDSILRVYLILILLR